MDENEDGYMEVEGRWLRINQGTTNDVWRIEEGRGTEKRSSSHPHSLPTPTSIVAAPILIQLTVSSMRNKMKNPVAHFSLVNPILSKLESASATPSLLPPFLLAEI